MDKDSFSDSPVRGLPTVGGRKLPPVNDWHPDICRDIDMCIHRDGSWSYQGSPIRRARMVRLFSTILRCDPDDRYYLVTPVEKCGITVEDVPFVVQDARFADGDIQFTTNVGDTFTVDDTHPLRFVAGDDPGTYIPYVRVRDRLDARVNRSVYYELMERGVEAAHAEDQWFGVFAGGRFWPVAPIAELGAERD